MPHSGEDASGLRCHKGILVQNSVRYSLYANRVRAVLAARVERVGGLDTRKGRLVLVSLIASPYNSEEQAVFRREARRATGRSS